MSFFNKILRIHKNSRGENSAQIFFTNTLTNEKERFVSAKPTIATLYSCGPTVYNRASIGNFRSYIFSDTIARILKDSGYRVQWVINITDVGHLVGDAETGEDKMSVGAIREKKSPEEIADQYTTLFINDLGELNVAKEEILFPRATQYIKEQIALAETLQEKGFAYQLEDGLYFDTTKFPTYGALGNRNDVDQEAGKRVYVSEKHHPNDFALWRSAKSGDLQQWDSPWGRGNPGWHLECSAMSRALLGRDIDIHTGGEDHINTHHNNEIAQSEAATGRRFVRYWMHNAFISMGGKKISKSLGNVLYISDLEERGYHPLSLRYFFLQAHYRTPISFSWEALEAAQGALKRLWNASEEIAKESKRHSESSEALTRFVIAMRDDMSTPRAIGILWDAIKDEDLSPPQIWGLIERADSLLGLSLVHPPLYKEGLVPENVQRLFNEREEARREKDFTKADSIREEIARSGYRVEDLPEKAVLIKDRKW